VMLLYASSRLVANLANIYMPIFLQESVHAKETMIALIPLVMSLSGVGSSFILKAMRKVIGKKASVMVGIVVGLLAATLSALPWMPEWALYCLAILWGFSGSLLVILSLAFGADIIGIRTVSLHILKEREKNLLLCDITLWVGFGIPSKVKRVVSDP
ncbi:Major facilitator superfamily domain-containing protein 12, partial [Halocaridina rubra]